jgi:hypothetical protein
MKSIPESEAKPTEQRVQIRVGLKLQADAYVEELGILHGFVKDISLQGLTFYLDRNLANNKPIKLRLHVPPLSSSDEPRLVVASGKTVHTIYDSHESNFRLGIKLVDFESDADKKFLLKYLNRS